MIAISMLVVLTVLFTILGIEGAYQTYKCYNNQNKPKGTKCMIFTLFCITAVYKYIEMIIYYYGRV